MKQNFVNYEVKLLHRHSITSSTDLTQLNTKISHRKVKLFDNIYSSNITQYIIIEISRKKQSVDVTEQLVSFHCYNLRSESINNTERRHA